MYFGPGRQATVNSCANKRARSARVILACCVVTLCAANFAVFVGGQIEGRLDFLANAAPVFLAVGVGLLLLVMRLRSRVWIGLAALSLAPSLVAVFGDLVGGHQAPAARSAARIKVMSLNVWSQNRRIDAVEALIRAESPDILFLQEASTKRHRDLLERLGDMYPANINIHPACSTRILTRLPLIEEIDLAACSLVGARLELPKEMGGGEVLVASAHLPRALEMRREGEREILRAASLMGQGGGAILAGDFNRTPWSAALGRFDRVQGMSRRTRGLATWPQRSAVLLGNWTSPVLLLPIDHIYATSDWRTIEVRAGPDVGSDHAPVVALFARERP